MGIIIRELRGGGGGIPVNVYTRDILKNSHMSKMGVFKKVFVFGGSL